MTLLDRLDAARERWNVLRHPFYARWERGELEPEELAFYAGQYRHVVLALAEATDAAACAGGSTFAAELEEHAAEERAHVELWDDFAEAVGGPTDADPLAETCECRDAWTSGLDLVDHLTVLYTIEAGQPAISSTKLDGLVTHYGMSQGDPGTAYFELHAERDHEHAAHSRELIEKRVADLDSERLVELAEAALRGNWRLLDGVERRFGR